jgi:hypothetical protein
MAGAETAEHHDAPLVLQFYSRAHLARLLLPYLRRSSAAPAGARVVSVHAPGHEGAVRLDDLGLTRRPRPTPVDWLFPGWLRRLTGLDPGYVLGRVKHSAGMTTLFFEELARREREGAERPLLEARDGTRGVAFLHVFPGLVKTEEFAKGDFPPVVKFFLVYVMLTLITPFTVAVGKVGESIAAMAEDARLRGAGAAGQDAEGAAVGSDGTVGSGVYCLNWDGKRLIKDKTMAELREKGAVEIVWDHCLRVFDSHSEAR